MKKHLINVPILAACYFGFPYFLGAVATLFSLPFVVMTAFCLTLGLLVGATAARWVVLFWVISLAIGFGLFLHAPETVSNPILSNPYFGFGLVAAFYGLGSLAIQKLGDKALGRHLLVFAAIVFLYWGLPQSKDTSLIVSTILLVASPITILLGIIDKLSLRVPAIIVPLGIAATMGAAELVNVTLGPITPIMGIVIALVIYIACNVWVNRLEREKTPPTHPDIIH